MIGDRRSEAISERLEGKRMESFEVKFCEPKMVDKRQLEADDIVGLEQSKKLNESASKQDEGNNANKGVEVAKQELVLSIRSVEGEEEAEAGNRLSDEMIEKGQNGDVNLKLALELQGGGRADDDECDKNFKMKLKLQLESQPIRTTRKRYAILLMFVVLHTVKSFQWICLASITNTVANFYGVDNLAINWTTILFMVTFLVLALPVSWIMDSIGLRRSVLIGSLGVTSGVCIKCFSCTRDGFPISMLGHLLVGLTEPFFFSSYAQVASTWFPDHQVAMATSASLIGEQTGLALGFIIPPLMVGNDPNDFHTIQEGLQRLFVIVAVICVINTCSILFFFDAKPKFAPGVARQRQIHQAKMRKASLGQLNNSTSSPKQQQQQNNKLTNGSSVTRINAGQPAESFMERGRRMSRRMSQSLGEQMKLSSKFVTNKHFILLLTGFGINMGISYSLHTLLNQMIMRPTGQLPSQANFLNSPTGGASSLLESSDHLVSNNSTGELALDLATNNNYNNNNNNTSATLFPKWHAEETNLIVGNAGLILIIAGLIGSGLCGFILDRYHRYKLTAAIFYLLALLSMGAMSFALLLENELALYLVTIPLGFALTGYASCAFDYGVEITYPKPELLSSTLLNISAQLFGIPISLVGSLIVDNYGSQALGAFFCTILLIGFVVTLLQGGSLRRQEAVREGAIQQLSC